MFFLFRSVFWLCVVFSSMSWGGGSPTVEAGRPQALREAAVQSGYRLAGAATEAVIDGAKAWCVESPRQCLADAAQLTALVAANQTEDLGEPAASELVPLPPADPRRHATPRS